MGVARKFGPGQEYVGLGTALAALQAGDWLESYGAPIGEPAYVDPTGPGFSTSAGDVVWDHYLGDYLFDGLGVTNSFLLLYGDRWTFNVGERVKVTRYNASVFRLGGDDIVVNGFDLYGCATGVGTKCYGVYPIGDRIVCNDTIFRDSVDNNDRVHGFYVGAGNDIRLNNCIARNIVTTGAAGRSYGSINYAFDTIYDGCSFSGIDGPSSYGLFSYFGGAGAVDVRRLTAFDCKYGLYAYSGVLRASDCRIYDASSYGIMYVGGPGDSAGSMIDNSTMVRCVIGLRAAHASATPMPVRNNIVRESASWGFYCTDPAQIASDHNTAFDAPWAANWPDSVTPGSDKTEDPLFVDADNNDFRLSPPRYVRRGGLWVPLAGTGSPCIDSGIRISGRTHDIDEQPVSGLGADRGCHEYQRGNPRNIGLGR